MKKKIIFRNSRNFFVALFAILFYSSGLHSQSNFFTPIDNKTELPKARKVVRNIKKLNVFLLDEIALRQYLESAPVEFQNNGNFIPLEIPLPDGRTEIFGLVESSILAPEIAEQHPEIKSYTGNGLNYKNAIIRLTLTSEGLHIVILDLNGEEIYFEKYSDDDNYLYFNYFTRDALAPANDEKGRCEADHDYSEHNQRNMDQGFSSNRNNTGGNLRTFRLAIAANGEFTARHGGVTPAFARVVNYVATINVIYRRELSIHFNLVSGTSIVFPDPVTDPYTTNDQGLNLGENQVVLDNEIGSANYDVGHLLGYEGNNSGAGLASFESVCDNFRKGQGTSGEGDAPYAQVFFDQLISHEMGHQFGMSHSYNSVIPVCTTRNPATSVEPGAGATIMSYGFTCGTDDYFSSTTEGPFLNFHTASYFQADTFINTISCQSSTSTGNNPPVVTMPPAYTIPHSTPFALTGSTDSPETDDSYTYSWEGIDIGAVEPNASTLDDTTQPPFFRSYAPTTSPTRTFPVLSSILDGTNQAKGDKLPSISIVTNLRFTVRDNNTAGGGVSYGDLAITIDDNIGPFLETTNLNGAYEANSTQEITWSVNGTNVTTPNVNILLSIDGGQTFPFSLASSTANDGSEVVTLPSVQTSTARIKVEAIGNIFFDISNFNFSINIPGCTATNSIICPTDAVTLDQGDAGLDLNLNHTFGEPVSQINISTTNGNPAGEIAYDQAGSGGTNCSNPWGVERYTTYDFSVSTSGSFTFTKGVEFVPFSIFVSDNYDPNNPCAGTFLGSNSSGVITVSNSATVNLNACTTYKLVAWEINGDNFSTTITMSGPGDVYSVATPPVNTGYTYIAVNTANDEIAFQNATADFTSLAGGTYKIYGASYKNGGATPPDVSNPSDWVGQTFTAVQSSECVVFSSNFKTVSINSSIMPITPDVDPLPDVTEQCEATPMAPTANEGEISATADVSFPITNIGTTVVNWTYDDGNGNTFTQTQNVIIESSQLTWNGSISSDWNDTNNWTPNSIPEACSELIIPVTPNLPELSGIIEIASLELMEGTTLTVPSVATLNISGDLNMFSQSNTFSGLIVEGTLNVSGAISYNRFVNSNLLGNDLISAPLAGQTWTSFLNPVNATTLLSNSGTPTVYAFAPFDKSTGDFENYDFNTLATLTSGTGYRAATNTGETLKFTGTIPTNLSVNIINTSTSFSEWNLVGNPYPSYINVHAFLNHQVESGVSNLNLFVDESAAIYGYDGNAANGWTIYNLANTNPSTVMAPGQGFFVTADAAKVAAYDLEFTPAMQSIGNSDDFIAGRNAELVYFKLGLSSNTNTYNTDVYFNANATEGLDKGYDAILWGTEVPEFSIYSHLLQDNVGKPIAIQTLNSTDLSEVSIPLGVNASQGEQIIFSIDESTLPASVNVYLEDVVANTTTLLNTSDYIITPTTNLSGTGRFFLRTSEEVLSTIDNNLDSLNIFALNSTKELVITGHLQSMTTLELYDIQGRRVVSTTLDNTTLENRIDVSSLSGGAYIVNVQNNKQQKSQKIVLK